MFKNKNMFWVLNAFFHSACKMQPMTSGINSDVTVDKSIYSHKHACAWHTHTQSTGNVLQAICVSGGDSTFIVSLRGGRVVPGERLDSLHGQVVKRTPKTDEEEDSNQERDDEDRQTRRGRRRDTKPR